MKVYYHYLLSIFPKRRSRAQSYSCGIVTFNRYLIKTIYRAGKFMVLPILHGGWSMWYARIWGDKYTNPQFDIGVQSQVIEIRGDTEEGNMEADAGEHAFHMPRHQLLSRNFRFSQTGNLHVWPSDQWPLLQMDKGQKSMYSILCRQADLKDRWPVTSSKFTSQIG